MNRSILTAVLAMTGSLALAQGGAPANGATVPVAAPAAAPAMATPIAVTPPGAVAATNAASSKPDAQALYAELLNINRELRPLAEKLQTGDPEIKALNDKRAAARQALMDLESQGRDLLDKKLSEDPKLAPLVEKRRELVKSLKELQTAAAAAGGHDGRMMGGMGGGMGGRQMMSPDGAMMQPRRMPSADGAVPPATPAPVAAPAPDADKTAVQK